MEKEKIPPIISYWRDNDPIGKKGGYEVKAFEQCERDRKEISKPCLALELHSRV